jgi:hypothetical protein
MDRIVVDFVATLALGLVGFVVKLAGFVVGFVGVEVLRHSEAVELP